jgi:hypothetical protein
MNITDQSYFKHPPVEGKESMADLVKLLPCSYYFISFASF